MRIGPHAIDPKLILAPMAGVTDKPFRQLCKRLGAAGGALELHIDSCFHLFFRPLIMFEQLEKLRPDLDPMFDELTKASPDFVRSMKRSHPRCPDSYFSFLLERGTGALTQDGEFFFFDEQLLSAEEFFGEHRIYEQGAIGDVMLFGREHMGIAYGFDTGAEWRLVEVDEFQIVSQLSLSFEQFVAGLVLCYPQIPVRAEGTELIDCVGTRYRIPSSL